MHRLVGQFILNDMERGSGMWNEAYRLALLAVHKAVKTKLEKDGNSFHEFPYVLGNIHFKFVAHSVALVHHHYCVLIHRVRRSLVDLVFLAVREGNLLHSKGTT